MGLLKRLAVALFGSREEDERQHQEDEKQRRAILASGPVIVSTTDKFHKAEYADLCRHHPKQRLPGYTAVVIQRCPNNDHDYIPNSAYVGSRKYPNRGIVSDGFGKVR